MAKRARGKYAYGFCDRSGFKYPLGQLKEEFVQGNPTGKLVGADIWDDDHPQNWVGKLGDYVDAQLLPYARPDVNQDESRRMYSFNPVGVGALKMNAYAGRVTVS